MVTKRRATEIGDAAASRNDRLGQREIRRVFGGFDELDSVVGRIVIAVAMEIVEGRLLPGDDLNSAELARRFSSSRTPAREALILLEGASLVEIPPRRRPRVRGMTLHEVRDMYELRAQLYELVSRRIVEHCDQGQIDRLREAHDELEDAACRDDLAAYFWSNVDFHNLEADVAGNDAVRDVLDSIGLRMLRVRRVSLSLPGRLDTSLDDHRRLMRAYEDREADLAGALSRSILHRGLMAVEKSGVIG